MSKQPLTQGEFEQKYGAGKVSRLSRAAVPDDIAPGRPRFPQKLSPVARATFKRLVRDLESRRHATPGDRETLALYAVTYDRWMRARTHLETEGDVVETTWTDKQGNEHSRQVANPYLAIATVCEKNLFAILQALGLTPATRSKIKVAKEPEADKPLSPEEEYFSRAQAHHEEMKKRFEKSKQETGNAN
jgi:P27 family predicted phage terminase small subunit